MKRTILSSLLIAAMLSPVACGQKKAENAAVAPATADTLLVETVRLVPQRFDHFVQVNGTVEAVQEAFISSETSGQIKRVHVGEGQRVSAGTLLVTLNTGVIDSAIDEVRSGLALAGTVHQRREELWKKKIGSEIQYLEAKTNLDALQSRLKSLLAQRAMAEIRAPIAGIVDRIQRKEGELAIPGQQLLQLVNLQKIRVHAELSESYLASVGLGEEVEISFPTFPALRRQAPLTRISQAVNVKNRTVEIEVVLDNAKETLKPNMMATLKVRDFTAENVLVVPAILVKNDLEGRFVYLVERQGGKATARKTYVQIGMTDDNRAMVTGGLTAGQELIVGGYNLVKNGSPLRVK